MLMLIPLNACLACKAMQYKTNHQAQRRSTINLLASDETSVPDADNLGLLFMQSGMVQPGLSNAPEAPVNMAFTIHYTCYSMAIRSRALTLSLYTSQDLNEPGLTLSDSISFQVVSSAPSMPSAGLQAQAELSVNNGSLNHLAAVIADLRAYLSSDHFVGIEQEMMDSEGYGGRSISRRSMLVFHSCHHV